MSETVTAPASGKYAFGSHEPYTSKEISALMYIRRISMRQMSKMLNISSCKLHRMFKYPDEERDRLLRTACTWVLENFDFKPTEVPA